MQARIDQQDQEMSRLMKQSRKRSVEQSRADEKIEKMTTDVEDNSKQIKHLKVDMKLVQRTATRQENDATDLSCRLGVAEVRLGRTITDVRIHIFFHLQKADWSLLLPPLFTFSVLYLPSFFPLLQINPLLLTSPFSLFPLHVPSLPRPTAILPHLSCPSLHILSN